MRTLLPSSVAIAIATIDIPGPPDAARGVDRQMLGIALFEAEEIAPGNFVHRLHLYTAQANASEAALFEWLTPRLRQGRIAIGWQLAETVVPISLEAADASPPQVARDFIDALADLVAIEAVDLAAEHDGVVAPSFEQLCSVTQTPLFAMSEAKPLNPQRIGRRIDLVSMLVSHVLATWHIWAQRQPPGDDAARRFTRAVFADWRIDDDDDDAKHMWRDEGGDNDVS